MVKSVKINVEKDFFEEECEVQLEPPVLDQITVIDFPMKKTEILSHNSVHGGVAGGSGRRTTGFDAGHLVASESPVNDEKNLIARRHSSLDHEFYYNLFVCCWRRPIMKLAMVVCFLSSISFLANLISLIAVGSQTAMHFAVEAVILVLEFFCLILLYYSLSHNTPKFMKPYMVFGVVWNMFLVLLWLFCLAELIKGEHFSFKVSTALSQIFIPSRRRHYNPYRQDGVFTAIMMLLGLGGTIVVNFWLLHIVVLAYFYLKQVRKNKAKYTHTAPSSPVFV